MNNSRKSVQSKLAAAALGVESEVAKPARARASSLTSALVDLKVGQDPVSKVVRLSGENMLQDLANIITNEKERLRNNVTSCISAAKRRIPGAQYSIECTQFMTTSGLYVAALVTRTE